MRPRETVVRVLVSSPSDTHREVAAIREATAELNAEWSEYLNVRLEVVSWRTHAVPAAGEDVQAILNEQLGRIDVYLGVFRERIGTPTPRAESGTVEEYEVSRERCRTSPGEPSVLLYFYNGKLSPNVDLEQLGRLREFRNRVESDGILTESYTMPNRLAARVRLALCKVVQGRSRRRTRDASTRVPADVVSHFRATLRRSGRHFSEIEAAVEAARVRFDALPATFKRFEAIIAELDALDAEQQPAAEDQLLFDVLEEARPVVAAVRAIREALDAHLIGAISDVAAVLPLFAVYPSEQSRRLMDMIDGQGSTARAFLSTAGRLGRLALQDFDIQDAPPQLGDLLADVRMEFVGIVRSIAEAEPMVDSMIALSRRLR